MKKEAIFAILIGIIVGLGITYGIYKVQRPTSKTTATNTEQQSETTPIPEANGNLKLLITSPKDESIVSSTQLRVSGTAEANEMIVILVNDKEYITQADSIGAFAQDVELASGGNIVQIIAITADGKQNTVTHHVVVSTASLDETADATEETASPSAKSAEKELSVTPTKKSSATPKPTVKEDN